MRSRIARDDVNVEVSSGPSGPELGTILSGLRTQYEEIVRKNKDEADQWYRKKVTGEGVTNTKFFKMKSSATVHVSHPSCLPAGGGAERGEGEQRGSEGSSG